MDFNAISVIVNFEWKCQSQTLFQYRSYKSSHFSEVTHHDSSGEELNTSKEFTKSIVSQSKPKWRETERYVKNQENLHSAEYSVQESAKYVDKPPRPIHHTVLVRYNTEIE